MLIKAVKLSGSHPSCGSSWMRPRAFVMRNSYEGLALKMVRLRTSLEEFVVLAVVGLLLGIVSLTMALESSFTYRSVMIETAI